MDSGELLDEQLTFSHPLLPVFYRRKRYDATVRVIVERRDELFKDVPIDQLVSLAFFSTPTDLITFGSKNPDLPSLVLQKYKSEKKHDLFHDWQMFCKVVDDYRKQPEYIVEGAIHFGSQVIPESWRHIWSFRGRELLQLLRCGRTMVAAKDTTQSVRHSPSSNQDVTGSSPSEAERPAPLTSSLDTDSQFVAEMPDASTLRAVLGGFLYVGMRTSFKRTQEEKKRLTGAVRLHAAGVHGGDFKLEVFVNASTGNEIVKAIGDEELLRDMLGDYLADAMEGSLWNQEEKRLGITGTTTAVSVVPTEASEGKDYRLFVLLRFSTGRELFDCLFPI